MPGVPFEDCGTQIEAVGRRPGVFPVSCTVAAMRAPPGRHGCERQSSSVVWCGTPASFQPIISACLQRRRAGRVGHESYERREEIEGSSDRSFGIVFAIVFAVIGLLPFAFGGGVRLWALLIGGAFLLVALALPSILAPLNRLWLRFGLLLHRIVSPIVLGIMFFVVITPMGLLMRALGKDLLRLKFDERSSSYWIARVPPGPPPESLRDQF